MRTLTQQQLADRVNEVSGEGYVHGVRWTKMTVAKLEPGTKEARRVTVDELLALALALECSVESLLLPRDPTVEVRVGGVEMPAYFLRSWIGGEHTGVPAALQQIGDFADGVRPPVTLAPEIEDVVTSEEVRKIYEKWARYEQSLGDEWALAFARVPELRDAYEELTGLVTAIGVGPAEMMANPEILEWWLTEWLVELESSVQAVRRRLQKRLRAVGDPKVIGGQK